jgi:hypothetical protein
MSESSMGFCPYCNKPCRNEESLILHMETCSAKQKGPIPEKKPAKAASAKASAKAASAKASAKAASAKAAPSVVEQFWDQFRKQREEIRIQMEEIRSQNPSSAEPTPSSAQNPSSAKPPRLPKPITDALKTLGNPEFNLPDIKSSFRKLALILHPDKNGNTPEATDAFRKTHEAYETLKEYLSKQKGGSNRQKYRKTKKTQKLRHKKHHRKTHRVRV